jgi:hypothetical protein
MVIRQPLKFSPFPSGAFQYRVVCVSAWIKFLSQLQYDDKRDRRVGSTGK